MKRFIIAFLIIVLFPVMAFAQLSLNSINTDLHTNYHDITRYQAYIAAQGFLTSADLSNYALKTDVYTQAQADILLAAKLDVATAASTYATITAMNLKANSADVYTTAAVDLLLLAKLDVSAISAYYTILQVDTLLLDKASTAAVALKIGRSDYFTDTLGGSVPPSGSTSGGTVLCDDGVFRSVASVGGGVTNAVDLNSSTASFSRLMNGLASNAQTALNQIDQNAATTAEVAAKANTADVYTKSETNDTIANAINAIPPPDLTGYYTKLQADTTTETYAYSKAQTNATIEAAIAAIPTPSVSTTITATAGEAISAGDVVRIINNGGAKAYKYIQWLYAGTAVTFEGSGFDPADNSTHACVLDSTHFAVVYNKGGKGYGVIGVYTAPDTIAFGTPVYLQAGGVNNLYMSCTTLDSTHFAVVFEDEAALVGYGVIGTFSGTNTVAFGTPVLLQSGGKRVGLKTSCTTLDSTHIFTAFYDQTTNNGFGVIGVYTAPNTIAFGTPVDLMSGAGGWTNAVSTCTLDSTHVAVTLNYAGLSKGYGVIGVFTAPSTIAFGTPVYLQTGGVDSSNHASCKIDSTHFLVIFNDGAANKGYGVVGTFSSTNTVAFGTPVAVSGTSNIYDPSAKNIDSTHCFVTYCSGGGGGYGVIVTYTAPSTIAFGTPFYLTGTNTVRYASCDSFDVNHFVVAGEGTSNYGVAIPINIGTFAPAYTSMLPAFSNSAVNSGSSGVFTLITPGLKYTNSAYGLTALTSYYLDYHTSTLTSTSTNNTSYYVGTALDTTSIFLSSSGPTTEAASTTPISLQRK